MTNQISAQEGIQPIASQEQYVLPKNIAQIIDEFSVHKNEEKYLVLSLLLKMDAKWLIVNDRHIKKICKNMRSLLEGIILKNMKMITRSIKNILGIPKEELKYFVAMLLDFMAMRKNKDIFYDLRFLLIELLIQ